MPKKTLALICGLVLITFILFVIALNSNNNLNQQKDIQQTEQQTSINSQSQSGTQGDIKKPQVTQARSVLNINPNPVTIIPGQQGNVEVNINTSSNEVTAIQLEIAYDPNYITNVKITPGSLMPNPVVLINNNRVKEGRYTFAYGIMPNRPVIQGVGNVANITFTAINKTGGPTQLALLPETLVTARGVSESVLKSATGTLIQINPSSPILKEE